MTAYPAKRQASTMAMPIANTLTSVPVIRWRAGLMGVKWREEEI
jgi:hypothetical protein